MRRVILGTYNDRLCRFWSLLSDYYRFCGSKLFGFYSGILQIRIDLKVYIFPEGDLLSVSPLFLNRTCPELAAFLREILNLDCRLMAHCR